MLIRALPVECATAARLGGAHRRRECSAGLVGRGWVLSEFGDEAVESEWTCGAVVVFGVFVDGDADEERVVGAGRHVLAEEPGYLAVVGAEPLAAWQLNGVGRLGDGTHGYRWNRPGPVGPAPPFRGIWSLVALDPSSTRILEDRTAEPGDERGGAG